MWAVGSEVVVRTLGNKRGIVVDVGRNARYQVRVENAMTWCREDDLAAPPRTRRRPKASPGRARLEHPADRGREDAAAAARIDLHGLRIDEAIEKMMAEIDRSLQRGADRLEIVHGKGSGRIKDALHRRLAQLSVVAAFRLDPRNSGVTLVYF
jgi:DNA mismatch repair protein MutS2